MRPSDRADSSEAKAIAREKYAERKIDKWIKWSWNVRGKVIYKELIEQINKYERRE